jgi:FKBP-type peptidyl-prolyl cis-trans isomerase FkpA
VKKAALIFVTAMGLSSLAQAQTTSNEETLPSGVRILHTVKGTGAQPSAESNVTVNYRGTLVGTGTEFDSSYKRGQPASFNLGRVVPCWQQSLEHMAVGGKARVLCPAASAYGSRGAGNVIPPNATLIFDIELLAVN